MIDVCEYCGGEEGRCWDSCPTLNPEKLRASFLSGWRAAIEAAAAHLDEYNLISDISEVVSEIRALQPPAEKENG